MSELEDLIKAEIGYSRLHRTCDNCAKQHEVEDSKTQNVSRWCKIAGIIGIEVDDDGACDHWEDM